MTPLEPESKGVGRECVRIPIFRSTRICWIRSKISIFRSSSALSRTSSRYDGVDHDIISLEISPFNATWNPLHFRASRCVGLDKRSVWHVKKSLIWSSDATSGILHALASKTILRLLALGSCLDSTTPGFVASCFIGSTWAGWSIGAAAGAIDSQGIIRDSSSRGIDFDLRLLRGLNFPIRITLRVGKETNISSSIDAFLTGSRWTAKHSVRPVAVVGHVAISLSVASF